MLDVVMQLCGLGTHIHKWLGEPRVVNWSIVATSIWRYMGFMFVIFYVAIASIPSDIYEAAAIERCKCVAEVLVHYCAVHPSGDFREPGHQHQWCAEYLRDAVHYDGGANGTKTFLMNILDTAFKYNKYGVASSMSLVLLAVVLLVAALQKAVIGKEEKMQ